ncbi:MAG: hypothetical protein HY851_02565 [candidate division Zixibacteria bacterium]|nr:hypothetical protein [candidate division Zixibacteria bacterium]
MSQLIVVALRQMLPQPGFFRRMRVYCQVMFPLPSRLVNATLLYISFAVMVCRINGWPINLVSGWAALGVGNLFLLAFILRLMDELKDRDIDRQLFADRPVPSGLVLESDIRLTLAVTTLLYIAVNLASMSTFWFALICLIYTYLMMVYFFAPTALRGNLLLNLATHNPSAPLMLALVVALLASQHVVPLGSINLPDTTLAIAMFWSLVLSWELSRKIRSREEENDYVTYSRIFGRVPATMIVLGVQAVALMTGIALGVKHQLSFAFYVILIAAYLVPLWAAIRFIVQPSAVTSKLRPFAETYAALVFVSIIVEQLWRWMRG